ncbi:unnamed protein product [Ectocarpus sp. 4 AP-2014]
MTPSRAWRSSMCAVLALASSLLAPTAVGFVSPKVNIAVSHRRCTGRRSPPPHMMLPSAEAAAAAGVEQLLQGVLRASDLVGGGAVPPPWAVTLADDVGGGGLLDMDPAKLGLFALGGLGVAAAGFSTAVYWRMQYVVAALLTNRVPAIQGGAEVLELSAKDTKTLYYMPTGGVRRLTLSTVKDLENEIVNGAAIQAKIPTALVRKQEGTKISCTSGTMDCVVSVYGFSGGVAAAAASNKGANAAAAGTLKGLASEVARVLKPGGTVLFVEKGESQELVDALREALGTVEVNMVTNLVDPYCVAMATKTKVTEEDVGTVSGGKSAAGEGAGRNRRERRQMKKAAAANNGS